MIKYIFGLFLFAFVFTLNGQNPMECTPVPVNDDPCLTDQHPPYLLGVSGSHIGSTCCANGVGEGDEYPNQACSSGSEENIVWYRASYDANFDGVEINVKSVAPEGATENMTVEVYVGSSNAACDRSFEYRKSSCSALHSKTIRIGCLNNGDYIWIKIGTTEQECGKFEIEVESVSDCDIADTCEEVGDAQYVKPKTIESIAPQFNDCLQGCLAFSCPEIISNGCDFNVNPTVWYKVKTDFSAINLYINVISEGVWTPMISVYKADPDCSNLLNANINGNPCSSTTISPNYYSVGVSKNTIYYIAISASDEIDNPNFSICFGTTIHSVACIGEENDCEPDHSFVIKVIDREYPDFDKNPNGPFVGPFYPGEEIKIHMEAFYDATKTNNEWFLGFVPGFSNGFNTKEFDYEANLPEATGSFESKAVWNETGTECGPVLMYEKGIEHLGTYKKDGVLKLCNALCEPCSNVGMSKGDSIPSMYSWLSTGVNIDCIEWACSPSRHWGIGTSTSFVNWDFTIKVNEFDNDEKCKQSEGLKIDIQMFSDGIAGCWDSDGLCAFDKKQIGPTWPIFCGISLETVVTPSYSEICSGNVLDINVSTEDASKHNIIITHDDFGKVDGMMDYEGESDFLITDTLKIIDSGSCEPITVYYYTRIKEIENSIIGTWDTIEVVVYPELKIDISATPESARLANDGSAIVSTNCDDGVYQYQWSNGDTTKLISNLKPGMYYVTVENQTKCTVIDSVVINQFTCDLKIHSKIQESCFGTCNGSILISKVDHGVTPLIYSWNDSSLLNYIENLCYGSYGITITDSVGCVAMDSFFVDQRKLKINSNVSDLTCYEACDGTITITNIEDGIEPMLYNWNTGSTLDSLVDLCSGDYSITIVDSLGCIALDTFIVNEPERIVVNVDTILNITESGLGAIFISMSDYKKYTFNWIGPNDFKKQSRNLLGLDTKGCYTLTVVDTFTNCVIDTTICISDLTDILENELVNKIKVYPNPTSDNFYIDFGAIESENAELDIMDISGRKIVKSINLNGQQIENIKVDDLTHGLYFLKIKLKEGTVYKKIIVE